MSFFGRISRSLPHDQFLYLGNNEQGTHEYISKMLGKQTIDTNTYGQSKGRNSSYTTNSQNAGRDLMTADEIRLLDNNKALLLIRGERPVIDDKYNVFKHPNISLTPYQGGKKYEHGISDIVPTANLALHKKTNLSEDTITFTQDTLEHNPYEDAVIITEDELEVLYKETK